jgi:hypothetical protein
VAQSSEKRLHLWVRGLDSRYGLIEKTESVKLSSIESRGFSPGSSHRESWTGWVISQYKRKIVYATRVKIEKINNLLQVDIDRREQGCAAHYEQYCQHVVTALSNCNNLEQHGSQLVHSWPHNIVHACRYQLRLSCNNLCVFSRVSNLS